MSFSEQLQVLSLSWLLLIGVAAAGLLDRRGSAAPQQELQTAAADR